MAQLIHVFERIDNEVNKPEERKKRKYKELISYISKLNKFSQMDIEDYTVEKGVADFIAEDIKEKMKVNQLRKFFEGIKRIQMNYKKMGQYNDKKEVDSKELYKILPELAYAFGRKLITEDYYKVIKMCIRSDDGESKIKTIRDLKYFVDFLSAILAYHKMHTKA